MSGSVPTTVTTYTDAAAAENGRYSYDVVAFDRAGNVSERSEPAVVLVDTAAPTAPVVTAAKSPTDVSPQISWTPSSDRDSGVSRYEVRRNATSLGSTKLTAFADTNLSNAGSYTYAVRAVDVAGNTSIWGTATVEFTGDVEPPSAPGNLRAGRHRDGNQRRLVGCQRRPQGGRL